MSDTSSPEPTDEDLAAAEAVASAVNAEADALASALEHDAVEGIVSEPTE